VCRHGINAYSASVTDYFLKNRNEQFLILFIHTSVFIDVADFQIDGVAMQMPAFPFSANGRIMLRGTMA
jgi:hypothetical protein